jgi:hypothetical protein
MRVNSAVDTLITVDFVDLHVWAATTAEQYLSPLGRRWTHVRAVAERARQVAAALPMDDADLLVPAAYLHDVGYAPALATERFHPLDGGRFVRAAGHERLACLVAHHSGARREAVLRGYSDYSSEFTYENTLLAQALTYCDMTRGPAGQPVTVRERVAEIVERYGSEHTSARAIAASKPEFLDIEERLDVLMADQRTTGAAPDR